MSTFAELSLLAEQSSALISNIVKIMLWVISLIPLVIILAASNKAMTNIKKRTEQDQQYIPLPQKVAILIGENVSALLVMYLFMGTFVYAFAYYIPESSNVGFASAWKALVTDFYNYILG